jgi:hypothetical protein
MRILTGVVLLLVAPMVILNPLGRSAFLDYYTGVIATWAAYVIALRPRSPKDISGAAFKLTRPWRTKALRGPIRRCAACLSAMSPIWGWPVRTIRRRRARRSALKASETNLTHDLSDCQWRCSPRQHASNGKGSFTNTMGAS